MKDGFASCHEVEPQLWGSEVDKKRVAGRSAKDVSEQRGLMTVSAQLQILHGPICLTSFSSDASKLAFLVSIASWFQKENQNNNKNSKFFKVDK